MTQSAREIWPSNQGLTAVCVHCKCDLPVGLSFVYCPFCGIELSAVHPSAKFYVQATKGPSAGAKSATSSVGRPALSAAKVPAVTVSHHVRGVDVEGLIVHRKRTTHTALLRRQRMT